MLKQLSTDQILISHGTAMIEIYNWYDGPLLYLSKMSNGQLHINHMIDIDEDANEVTYLMIPVTLTELEDLKQNRWDLLTFYLLDKHEHYWVTEGDTTFPMARLEFLKRYPAATYLPDPGEYLLTND